MTTLTQEIRIAGEREQNDDHLTEQERESLVRRYRAENPNEPLPNDMTDAYIEIVLG